MKKCAILIGCLILASVFLFGCGSTGSLFGCSGETVETIVSDKPWTTSSNYEYVSYKLTRYSNIGDASSAEMRENATTEAEGYYHTTLTAAAGNLYTDDAYDALKKFSPYFAEHFSDPAQKQFSTVANTYTLLVTEYSLTYTQESAHSGKTDTIESALLFRTNDLTPVFSEKKATMETAPANSYTATADYINGTNVLTTSAGSVTTEITKNTAAYDNESLYFVIRAHSSLASGSSATVSVHNSVYTGLADRESARSIVFQSGTTDLEGIDPDRTFMPKFFGDGEVTYYAEDTEADTTTDGGTSSRTIAKGYALPVYAALYQLNETNRGTTKTLLFSRSGFRYVGETTTNVMLGFSEIETDTDGNSVYATSGIIDDYSTVKPA